MGQAAERGSGALGGRGTERSVLEEVPYAGGQLIDVPPSGRQDQGPSPCDDGAIPEDEGSPEGPGQEEADQEHAPDGRECGQREPEGRDSEGGGGHVLEDADPDMPTRLAGGIHGHAKAGLGGMCGERHGEGHGGSQDGCARWQVP